jgi:TRAP-type C4-dicarboxylate transport system substrate-binding protein
MGSPASIAGTIGIALAVASGVATVASAQTIIWNHNLFGPPRAVTAGMEAMAEFYKKESNGTFEIKLAYGSALGPEKQIPEGIKSGGYEGGMLCAGYYPNKFPLLMVMELPFLPPRSLDDNAKVNETVLNHPLIVKEMAERWNMKYLGPTFLPAFEFMGNKRIASVADMKGVKMRIAGLNAKALQVYGAVPTMVTAPEGYEALQRGTIDSFGFPYSFAFGAYKLHEVSKFATEGMAMSGFLCFQGVSLTAWNKLPDALKAKLPQAQAPLQAEARGGAVPHRRTSQARRSLRRHLGRLGQGAGGRGASRKGDSELRQGGSSQVYALSRAGSGACTNW